MSQTFLFSQICSGVGLIFFALTFLSRDRNKILFLSILMAVFYSLEYLLLGSVTGCVVKIIGIVRGVWYFLELKRYNKNSLVSMLTIEILTVFLSIITWKSVEFSLLPMLANIIYAYALWQKNNKVFKVLTVLTSCLWLIFSFYIGSIVGAVSRSIIVSVQFIIFMFDITKKN